MKEEKDKDPMPLTLGVVKVVYQVVGLIIAIIMLRKDVEATCGTLCVFFLFASLFEFLYVIYLHN